MSNFFTEASLNFKEIKEIGNGGEGVVLKAHDLQLGAILAIKKVPIVSIAKPSLFFDEAKKLYITRHQNVVPVNYGCQDSKYIYLAMPFYNNGSMKSLTDKLFLTSREIVRYSLQFLSGLNNVHVKKLVHFDVKTENILINDSNQAVLSDFGLAQHTSHYGFATVFGTTPVLAPPELFSQSQHNLKFDIYQAGMAMYRMSCGDTILADIIDAAHYSRGKYHNDNFIKNLVTGKFPNRSLYLPHIPVQLRKVINKALEINPDDRYSSVIEMMNDLSKIDTAHDWQYENNGGGNERWSKPDYEILAKHKNGQWELLAIKKGRKKKEYCVNTGNIAKKNSLIYKYLLANW